MKRVRRESGKFQLLLKMYLHLLPSLSPLTHLSGLSTGPLGNCTALSRRLSSLGFTVIRWVLVALLLGWVIVGIKGERRR